MTEMEKMKAGLEYCFTDKELIARKSLAIVRCEEYNAIDGMDRQAQYEYLKQMLGGVGKRAWIAKRFSCDCGKNIFVGDDFFRQQCGHSGWGRRHERRARQFLGRRSSRKADKAA
jgi:maltose O-acetyltransferase